MNMSRFFNFYTDTDDWLQTLNIAKDEIIRVKQFAGLRLPHDSVCIKYIQIKFTGASIMKYARHVEAEMLEQN